MTNIDPWLYSPDNVEELGLKYKEEQDLFETLLESGESWTDEQRRMVVDAYNLARVLHEDDKHRDLPYTYHLLRNANRVTGYLHITDPEIITAVILHDSVEDHPDEILKVSIFGRDEPPIEVPVPEDPYTKQQAALKTLEVLFSPRVATIVAAVTNAPEISGENISYEERLQRYADKVKKAVLTPEGWITKFVDWLDNGVGIVHSDMASGADKAAHFSRKYGMVQPTLEQRYYQADIEALLDPTAKAYIEHQFQLGRARLTTSDGEEVK